MYFTGADGAIHIFRIAGLGNLVTAEQANAALDDIAGTGAFANAGGAVYLSPVSAVVTATETTTIVKR